jgi:cellulose synthase/poly-beta-1,6-N-acetylglucosamine synthase-like glycosyltransferase
MIEIITSFDKRYYDLIGQDCVSSFLKFWDPQFSLTCYTEGFKLDPHKRIKQINFDQEVDAEYAQLQADTNYGVQVKKFSKKAFSFIHAMYHSTADWILWLDADVVTTRSVPAYLIVDCMRDEDLSMYMGVTYTTDKSGNPGSWLVPETGVFAVNTRHANFETFRNEYRRRYVDRDHADLRRFYDNDVFGAAINLADAPVYDLCAGFAKPYKTPLPHTVLGDYLTHYKAKHSKAEYQVDTDDQ